MKSDRESYGLHGPVRSVRTEGVDLFDGISQERLGNRWADEELLFDTKGRLIEDASADHYIDQAPFRLAYTYDEEGRTIERKGYNKDGSDAGTTVYSYDSDGNKTGKTYRYPGGQGKHQTVYDHRGNLTESALYLPDGTLTLRDTRTYAYKTEGNKVEEEFWHKQESRMPVTDETDTVYAPYTDYFALSFEKTKTAEALIDPEKGTWHKRVIIYDDAGHILEKIEYGPRGTWETKEIYDAEGRVVEMVDNGPGKEKSTYRYNERGLLATINQVRGPGGFEEPIDRKYFYTYDEIGNLIEAVVFESDGSLDDKESYIYEYDSLGNWTKKTKTWITKAGYKSVTEYRRIISYY